MSLSLSNLKPSVGSSKKRKRVGRGNASGHGTYSTRGLKGQKARSGVSGLKRLGMKKQRLAIPKTRGFVSYHAKDQAVTLGAISRAFSDGALVNPKTLKKAGLIASLGSVKILTQGDLKLKNLKFENVRASKGAQALIEKAGGTFAA